MIVADATTTLVLTGSGDVLEPEGGSHLRIGSGEAPMRSPPPAPLIDQDLDPEAIARTSR